MALTLTLWTRFRLSALHGQVGQTSAGAAASVHGTMALFSRSKYSKVIPWTNSAMVYGVEVVSQSGVPVGGRR